jgi:hypothetical protein
LEIHTTRSPIRNSLRRIWVEVESFCRTKEHVIFKETKLLEGSEQGVQEEVEGR